MVDAAKYVGDIFQNKKAIATVTIKEIGIAIFAGSRKPTNKTAADTIGKVASRAKRKFDISVYKILMD